MRHLARLTMASAVAVPLLAGTVRAQGNDLAIDFRTTDSGTAGGSPVDRASKGHAVISKDRVRYDMNGSALMMNVPGMAFRSDVTMIMLNSGKTLIVLEPNMKQFTLIHPAEMMEGMQKTIDGMNATKTFDISGDDPKVENLGPGPVLMGHHKVHYRVTVDMKVSMTATGGSRTIETSSVSDEYLAPDVENVTDPFRNFDWNMMGAFGPGTKAYLNRMRGARAKLPAGLTLRTERHVIVASARQRSDIRSVQEVTGIQKTTASPSLFEVPADYTKMTLPTIPRAK